MFLSTDKTNKTLQWINKIKDRLPDSNIQGDIAKGQF